MPTASRCWGKRQQNCLASTVETDRGGAVMTNWIETYRGTVPPWECDVTEHFTIAYYFERLEEAEPNLADALGLGERLRAGGFARRLHVRFPRELRARSRFSVGGRPPREPAPGAEEQRRVHPDFARPGEAGRCRHSGPFRAGRDGPSLYRRL